MELLWCRYQKTKSDPARFMLLLEVGRENDKILAYKVAGLNKKDVDRIRLFNPKLDLMNMEARIRWIEKQCPSAKSNFRTVRKDRVEVRKRYPIPSR